MSRPGYIIIPVIRVLSKWLQGEFMDRLLTRCLQGQQTAWDQFVDRYSPVISAAVRRLAGSRGLADQTHTIEDIIQEVFLRLLKDDFHLLRSFDPGRASLVTWLTVITRSTTIDFLRRRKLQTVALEQAPILACSDVGPDASTTTNDIPTGLLTARQRLVLHLLFDRQMEPETVGSLLGVSAQTIRSTKHKAIQRLRKHLSKNDLT